MTHFIYKLYKRKNIAFLIKNFKNITNSEKKKIYHSENVQQFITSALSIISLNKGRKFFHTISK